MNISYYVFGPLMLVTAGTTILSSLGYNIEYIDDSKEPAKGEPIYDVLEIIRKIKEEIPLEKNLKIKLYIIN